MKKTLILVVALMFVVSGIALASNISTTKHNMASSSTNTTKGIINEICIYCHTPHGAIQSVAPLWNRTAPVTATFTVYTSGTMNTTMPQPGGTSKACLSCHDGATSINALINVNGAAYNAANTLVTGIANLSGDLSNDHPISINVIGNPDTDINQSVASVMLFNNKVECASCHNVHDNTNAPFLRMTNTLSALCLACHNK